MTAADSFKTIQAVFARHGNPALVAKYSRYFREGYDAYGLDQEFMETWHQSWLDKAVIPSDKRAALELADLLVAHEKYESASLALYIVRSHLDELGAGDLRRLRLWFDRDIRNWAHSDVFCGEIFSPLIRKEVLTLARLKPWLSSPSRWTRRAVPVALIAFAKSHPDRIPELLDFISPLARDAERVVHQGLGWFLRECWKKNPAPTEAFLLTIKDSAARLIIQYATERMSKEARLRFKKAK